MPVAPAPDILAPVWRDLGLAPSALARLRADGDAPVYPAHHDVAGLAQATIAGVALAASEVWRAATGAALAVRADRRHAALEFRSERVFEVDGQPPAALWDSLAGAYRCGDGRWLRVHTNFAHHRQALCQVLDCAETPAAVTAALAGRAAGEVESAAAEAGAIAAMMRPMEAWRDSAQGQAVAGLPLISLARIGAAPKTPVRARARPLDGLKVLDLTRVIAGPVCGRVLAAHGADVLAISAPHLPSMAELTVDVGRGKRSAHLDLRADEDGRHLAALIGDADIFVQGYRPGGLAARGFGPAAVAALKPGIIYVSLSAYGHTGPWAGRRGFDSIAQTAIGLNHSEARAAGLADQPQVLPAQALDHASGYLMALGALAAVLKRAQEGGSWHVQVALARTGHWLQDLPKVTDGPAAAEPARPDDLLEESASGFGQLRALRHAGVIEGMAPRWTRPSVPLGHDRPMW